MAFYLSYLTISRFFALSSMLLVPSKFFYLIRKVLWLQEGSASLVDSITTFKSNFAAFLLYLTAFELFFMFFSKSLMNFNLFV